MQKNKVLNLAAIAIILLAIAMIVLGINAGILPPTITGVGFIIIALVFLSLKNK